MNRRLGVLPVIAFLLALPVAALAAGLPSAPPESLDFSADRLKRIDALMQRYVSEKKLAGMTIAVTRNGKLVYDKSAGVAGIARNMPMSSDSLARIYSMSKWSTTSIRTARGSSATTPRAPASDCPRHDRDAAPLPKPAADAVSLT